MDMGFGKREPRVSLPELRKQRVARYIQRVKEGHLTIEEAIAQFALVDDYLGKKQAEKLIREAMKIEDEEKSPR